MTLAARVKAASVLALTFSALLAAQASADVEISSKATTNMDCDAGVCTTTVKKAVLNVGDLQTMLASSDVAVKTGSLAKDIDVDQPLTWATTSRLTLDAQQSVTVKKQVTVSGTGALTITTDDGGSGGDLYFFGKGGVTFGDLSSSLIINGQSYTLAGDLPTLAAKMNNSNGSFALANDYDAKADHFKHSPVGYFEGNFEGLGHTISHLKMRGGGYQRAGMFAQIGGGTVRDIYLTNLNVLSKTKLYVGGLAGENDGTVVNASVRGNVTGTYQIAEVGGLVGENQGIVGRSRSDAFVSGNQTGGLTGENIGVLYQCYSTSTVSGTGAGGLTSENGGHVFDSYATGSVGATDVAGGLAAGTGGDQSVVSAYSTGQITGPLRGGLVGTDHNLTVSIGYWDLDTSGITDPEQGAGDPANDPGITGLTDAQLKAGLPAGFDRKIWGSDANINNGYPYLLANWPR